MAEIMNGLEAEGIIIRPLGEGGWILGEEFFRESDRVFACGGGGCAGCAGGPIGEKAAGK